MGLLSLFNKYKSSYYDSFKDLTIHSVIHTSSLYALWYCKDSCASLLTIPIVGLMNIRTFIIFHDCGHNSYTPSKQLNYIIGLILGIFVVTPFCWLYKHNHHHLTSGNIENDLNHYQNETIFHTLTEYKHMKGIQKKLYRIVRHPSVFFMINPFMFFIILERFNILLYKIISNHSYKQSFKLILFDTIFNNIGIVILLNYVIYYGLLYHCLISLIISFSLGFVLFHNQHTFNPSYVVTNEKWNKKDSGLKGSSFIQIPKYLKYFTSGIEYHHIHHMNSSIPGYNLQLLHEEVIQKSNEFNNITKLSINDCYHNLWLTLYDESNDKYISFNEADLKIKKES